jgi:hypothetical protein
MEHLQKPLHLTFPNGRRATAVKVQHPEDLPEALRGVGLQPRPTLVLVGGAGGLSATDLARLRPLFAEALVPLMQTLGGAVVDGGTDSGVMQLMGRARAEAAAEFPLVGVAAIGTVALPDAPGSGPEAAPLEPHHTQFILVPGSDWGDEAPWISRVASALAHGLPSLTVLVNGGEIAWQDVAHSVDAGRPVLALAGSGRTADLLARALRGEVVDERARPVMASGLVQAVELADDTRAFAGTMGRLLGTGG